MEPKDTKIRIIEKAEELFADHGIEGVSLRQINAAAGQKNASAVHYHFGSKVGLVNEIFRLRLPVSRRIRQRLLEAARKAPREDQSAQIVRAIVLPFADYMFNPEKSTNFVRFMAAVRADLSLNWSEVEAPDYVGLMADLTEIVGELHPQESARDLRRRMAVIQSFWLNGVVDIARYEHRRHEQTGATMDVRAAVQNLMTMMRGALMAPLHPGIPIAIPEVDEEARDAGQ